MTFYKGEKNVHVNKMKENFIKTLNGELMNKNWLKNTKSTLTER